MTGTLTRLRAHTSARRDDSSRLVTDHAPSATIALLPITADLLPRRASASREGRAVRLIALAMVIAAVAATVAWYLLAAGATSAATESLQRAQDREAGLMSRQHRFDDLVQTQQLTASIHETVVPLMAGDVPWATTFQALSDASRGVGFTAVTGTVPTRSADDESAAPDSTATTIGTLSVSAFAADKGTIADFVDAVAATPGFAAPFLTDVSQNHETGQFSFTLTIDVTSAIRGDTPSRWADRGTTDGSHDGGTK